MSGGDERKTASAHSCGSRRRSPIGIPTAYASDQSTNGSGCASNRVVGSWVA